MNEIVKAGVGVIILKDGKICTGIRKKTNHGQNRRAFPGGHIDFPDETFATSSEREVLEETGMVVKTRRIRGGWDWFSTLKIVSEDGQKKYVTTYTLADYVSGGEWINENTVRGLEPDKCDQWEFHTLEETAAIVAQDKDQTWIPIARITELWHEVVGRFGNEPW